MFRHAIGAAEITAIRYRHAQIIDRPPERVDHACLRWRLVECCQMVQELPPHPEIVRRQGLVQLLRMASMPYS